MSVRSHIVALGYSDYLELCSKNDHSIMEVAIDDLTFMLNDMCMKTEEEISKHMYFYEILINEKLFGVCYGVIRDVNLHYNVLFDQSAIKKNVAHSYIGYFIQHVINNTCKRLTTYNLYDNDTRVVTVITDEKNTKNKIVVNMTFQFDLPDRFPMLDDYSFLTKSPYFLRGSNRIFKLTLGM
jgi:hypothetical protein